MKFNMKKVKVLLLGLGILLGILSVFYNNNHTNSNVNFSSNLPTTSDWEQNGVQVTNGLPLITWDDMAMCSDGAGGVIIAWSDNRYAHYHVYAQRVDSSGNVLWTSNGVAMWDYWEDQTNVQICSDGAGGAIIVWEDNRNHIHYDDIFAQRVDANGILKWNIRGVPVVEATYYQSNPQLCSDGAGGAIITWDDNRGPDEDIYVQRINSAGSAQWTANGINICNMAGNQRRPQISSDEANGAIIAWQDSRPGASNHIYTQRINSAGTVQWMANGIVIYWAADSQGVDDIQSDGSGGAIIAWGGGNLHAQRINPVGTPLWTMGGLAVCTASGNQLYTRITSSGSGGAILTWEDRRGPSYDIYAQRINPAGIVNWTTNGIPVCNALGTQIYPKICSDGSDGAIITWEDKRDSNSDVYAQRIGYNGSSQWTPNGTTICTLASFQGKPQIVSDGSGHAIIAWEDTRTYSGRDIYALCIISSLPTSTHPSDVLTAFERTTNIEWALWDDVAGGQYRIIANDTNGDYYNVKNWTSWTINTLINISLNTTTCGFFEYTLQFNDSDGQYGTFDTVLVNIMENSAPTSNHPEDILIVKDSSKIIDWILDDEWDGGKYRIIVNDTNGDYYVYINWTSWSPNTSLNIPINTSIPGNYNYTIIYYDNQNEYGVQDTVSITILDDLIPICDHPADIFTVLGDTQYIRWTLNDDYGGGSYRIIANNSLGNFYVWRSWQSWIIGERTSIPIDRSELGVFNYTIEYYDSLNQYGIPDTVIVTVKQNYPPTCNNPEDITTIEGSETIPWILSDDYRGGVYRVIITTSAGASSTWIDWTSWDIDVPLNVPIDHSRTGVVNYTIEYRDIYGLYGMANTVKITIPSEEEGIPSYNLLVLLSALLGTIALLSLIMIKKLNKYS